MILKIILGYFLGYVRIKVESVFLERFLNICVSKKIFIWNVKREKSTILYANIGIKQFRRLKEVARKTKSIIKIESKKGIPFLMHRYRKRKIFLILFCLIIIGLIVMSNFIWNIEIEGLNELPEQELIKELKREGLKIGTAKQNIHSTQIVNRIRLKNDDISWIGIDIKGTNAIVKIKEKDKAPEIIDKSEYCNIISEKTGLITKINVQEGMASVAVGDLVRNGDLLVNGTIEGKFGDTRYVHSVAEIEAKIWYSEKEKFYYNEDVPVHTGKEENKYSIYLNNFKINFTKTLSKFQKYDTIEVRKKLILFPNFYLPIEFIKKTNKEYELVNKTYTEEELIELATQKLSDRIISKLEDQNKIVNKQVNTYKENDGIVVEVIYEVAEQIGIEEKIIL